MFVRISKILVLVRVFCVCFEAIQDPFLFSQTRNEMFCEGRFVGRNVVAVWTGILLGLHVDCLVVAFAVLSCLDGFPVEPTMTNCTGHNIVRFNEN